MCVAYGWIGLGLSMELMPACCRHLAVTSLLYERRILSRRTIGEAEQAEPLRDHHGTGLRILLQQIGDSGFERLQFTGTLPASRQEFAMAARAAGRSYTELIVEICELAMGAVSESRICQWGGWLADLNS